MTSALVFRVKSRDSCVEDILFQVRFHKWTRQGLFSVFYMSLTLKDPHASRRNLVATVRFETFTVYLQTCVHLIKYTGV